MYKTLTYQYTTLFKNKKLKRQYKSFSISKQTLKRLTYIPVQSIKRRVVARGYQNIKRLLLRLCLTMKTES